MTSKEYKTEIKNALIKCDKSIIFNAVDGGFECTLNTPIGRMLITLKQSGKVMQLFRVLPDSTLDQFNDVFAERQLGALNPHSLKWNVSTYKGDFKFILFCVTTMVSQIEEYIEDNK